jgi:hypothetical protein
MVSDSASSLSTRGAIGMGFGFGLAGEGEDIRGRVFAKVPSDASDPIVGVVGWCFPPKA